MKTWLTSFAAVIAFNIIGLVNFIGRSLLDWRYVFPEFFPAGSASYAYGAAFYILILCFWFWALVAAVQGSRPALIVMLAFNLVFLFVVGLGTYFTFCPSPCNVIWPVAEIVNWSNMVFGILTPLATGLYLRRRDKKPPGIPTANKSEKHVSH